VPVEPLPFDPRSPCFCHQNCQGFRQPTSRWWVKWQDPPPAFPVLGTGVLLDVVTQFPEFSFCFWEPETLPPGIQQVRFLMIAQAPFPGPDIFKSASCRIDPLLQFNDVLVGTNVCNVQFVIGQTGGGLNMGPATLTPVRWYQNADDVPH